MTKRLCVAEFSGTFCFVSDVPDEKLTEEAYVHATEMTQDSEKIDIDVDEVHTVDDSSEIPSGWEYKAPFGATKDCIDFFENLDEADRIAKRLEKLDYDLEDSFVEDLQRILNTPLGEEDESV